MAEVCSVHLNNKTGSFYVSDKNAQLLKQGETLKVIDGIRVKEYTTDEELSAVLSIAEVNSGFVEMSELKDLLITATSARTFSETLRKDSSERTE